jgi:hypothetical protein
MEENIKNLLQNVAVIQKKYDDIAEITGENFNIFSILKMDSKEVGTHSAFIGELLNVKGSHGLKDIPLKLFIDLLKERFEDKAIDFEIDRKSTITTIEKYAGVINEDKTEGGRIDIIVEDNIKNAIIIENKIYAIEQENQLIRYYNYCKINYKKAPILYLTLDGSKPNSAGEMLENKDYFNISYKEDIVKWLELCIKEAVDKPMLREVIKQYIYLIKKLTGQTISNEMSKDLVEQMRNNIASSFEIANNIEALKSKIYEDFKNHLKQELGNELIDSTDSEYGGFEMNIKDSDKKISLYFWKGNKSWFNTVFIGIKINPNEKVKYNNLAQNYIIEDTWAWKRPSFNWADKKETWIEIAKGKEGKCFNEVVEIVNELVEKVKVTP